MPRPRPPHLHLERTRHGKLAWYVRVGKGPRTRLTESCGTPEFDAQYRAALLGTKFPKTPKGVGTLAWAESLYRHSSTWLVLSAATRRQRESILRNVMKTAGHVPLKAISKAHIVQGRERRAKTPAAARNYLETMRGLFAWALEMELVRSNPTGGVKAIRPKSDGFPIWNEEDVEKFKARWPVGTRERIALDLLIHTGLRRGDVCRLGRQHVRDGVARISTEKSKFQTWVAIPLPEELLATLCAGPCGDLTFIASLNGAPLTKESFGNFFRDACRAAGIRKSAHGLRKVAATDAAESGFSNFEMDARFGWTGGQMAAHYTNKANRERLSLQAEARKGEGRARKTPYAS